MNTKKSSSPLMHIEGKGDDLVEDEDEEKNVEEEKPKEEDPPKKKENVIITKHAKPSPIFFIEDLPNPRRN